MQAEQVQKWKTLTSSSNVEVLWAFQPLADPISSDTNSKVSIIMNI